MAGARPRGVPVVVSGSDAEAASDMGAHCTAGPQLLTWPSASVRCRAVTSSPVPSERWPALGERRMLVVGASSGIGRALALLAAGAGASVTVAARRLEALEATVSEARAA